MILIPIICTSCKDDHSQSLRQERIFSDYDFFKGVGINEIKNRDTIPANKCFLVNVYNNSVLDTIIVMNLTPEDKMMVLKITKNDSVTVCENHYVDEVSGDSQRYYVFQKESELLYDFVGNINTHRKTVSCWRKILTEQNATKLLSLILQKDTVELMKKLLTKKVIPSDTVLKKTVQPDKLDTTFTLLKFMRLY